MEIVCYPGISLHGIILLVLGIIVTSVLSASSGKSVTTYFSLFLLTVVVTTTNSGSFGGSSTSNLNVLIVVIGISLVTFAAVAVVAPGFSLAYLLFSCTITSAGVVQLSPSTLIAMTTTTASLTIISAYAELISLKVFLFDFLLLHFLLTKPVLLFLGISAAVVIPQTIFVVAVLLSLLILIILPDHRFSLVIGSSNIALTFGNFVS